jgi:hypothetical protein
MGSRPSLRMNRLGGALTVSFGFIKAQGGRVYAGLLISIYHLNMFVPTDIFQLATCSIVALAGAVLLSALRHWFRQRCLQKIPGPSNPSLIWGKIYKDPYGLAKSVACLEIL